MRESINGRIRFNTQSRYQGTVFDNIEFEFKNGKIVRATANETKKINEVLDSDEGGRYCGEWAIGVNNRVRHPMLDTLFDEKIGGSFHLTPGNAYEIADNGNRSRIHWDLVQIQRPDYGGGEIWFDGELAAQRRPVPAQPICKVTPKPCVRRYKSSRVVALLPSNSAHWRIVSGFRRHEMLDAAGPMAELWSGA